MDSSTAVREKGVAIKGGNDGVNQGVLSFKRYSWHPQAHDPWHCKFWGADPITHTIISETVLSNVIIEQTSLI